MDLVSDRYLMKELGERMNFILHTYSKASKDWEDNIWNKNLTNSKVPLITFRTKHIDIKYHWFHSMIKPQDIEIHHIDTKEKRSYIFTKGLTRFNFEQLSTRILGY